MQKRAPVVENIEFAIRLDERLKVLIEIRTMIDQKKRLVRGLKEAVVDLDTRIERTYNALCRIRPSPESSSSISKSDSYLKTVQLIQQSRQR
jgi:hypothetical protein